MKILKYNNFVNEEFNDTPEQYIETSLRQLKRKIDKMFDYDEVDPTENEKKIKSVEDAKIDGGKKGDNLTLKDLGVKIESSEMSKYSKMYDSITIKFSDTEFTYNLFISIDIKEGVPKDPDKDFSFEDVQKCYIKFKKYDIETFDIIGQITKNAKIKEINEDFLINLKIEIDDKFSDGDEEFKIETN